MPRSYGPKKRTKADKRAAATQFVIMSDRSDEYKATALTASYGFNEAEAWSFIKAHKSKAHSLGASL